MAPFNRSPKLLCSKDISTQILLDSNIRRVFQNNKLSQKFLTANENRNPNYLNDTLIDCIISSYFQLLNLPIVSGTTPALNSIDSQLRKTGSMPLTKLVEQSLSSYTISFYTELAKTHDFIFDEQMEHSWF